MAAGCYTLRVSISPEVPPPPRDAPPSPSAWQVGAIEVPQRPKGYPLILPFVLSGLIMVGVFFGTENAQDQIVLIGVALSIYLYFLPTYIAYRKGKQKVNALPIFLVNLFLGWTLLGWVGSLVWACSTSIDDLKARAAWRNTEP